MTRLKWICPNRSLGWCGTQSVLKSSKFSNQTLDLSKHDSGFVQTGLGWCGKQSVRKFYGPKQFHFSYEKAILKFTKYEWGTISYRGMNFKLLPALRRLNIREGREVKQCNCDMNLKETNWIWKSTSFPLSYKRNHSLTKFWTT